MQAAHQTNGLQGAGKAGSDTNKQHFWDTVASRQKMDDWSGVAEVLLAVEQVEDRLALHAVVIFGGLGNEQVLVFLQDGGFQLTVSPPTTEPI